LGADLFKISRGTLHFLGISAGAVSSGLALAGIRAQRGGSCISSARSEMLAQLFGREPLPNSRYPETIEQRRC